MTIEEHWESARESLDNSIERVTKYHPAYTASRRGSLLFEGGKG